MRVKVKWDLTFLVFWWLLLLFDYHIHLVYYYYYYILFWSECYQTSFQSTESSLRYPIIWWWATFDLIFFLSEKIASQVSSVHKTSLIGKKFTVEIKKLNCSQCLCIKLGTRHRNQRIHVVPSRNEQIFLVKLYREEFERERGGTVLVPPHLIYPVINVEKTYVNVYK